jgi:hypothetical protein
VIRKQWETAWLNLLDTAYTPTHQGGWSTEPVQVNHGRWSVFFICLEMNPTLIHQWINVTLWSVIADYFWVLE